MAYDAEKNNKKRVGFRLSPSAQNYLKAKAKEEGISKTEVIEQLLKQDEQLETDFSDLLADSIHKKLDDKLKSIRIAVNENNKLLKINMKVLNYLLLTGNFKAAYHAQQNVKHPAMLAAAAEVKEDIKRLQVIKAEAKRKKIK